ncbi:mucin-1-like [Melospiza georgiana]|uniref:mucin-1-like n=1 Tax=Melospiza georgiana TaxID=44398 RepID=UPI0025AD2A83|nr:mucin-1-like [Melospiza georgiana]
MHHHPRNRERALNLSILSVSGPDLGFPGAARRVMGITPPDRQSASFMDQPGSRHPRRRRGAARERPDAPGPPARAPPTLTAPALSPLRPAGAASRTRRWRHGGDGRRRRRPAASRPGGAWGGERRHARGTPLAPRPTPAAGPSRDAAGKEPGPLRSFSFATRMRAAREKPRKESRPAEGPLRRHPKSLIDRARSRGRSRANSDKGPTATVLGQRRRPPKPRLRSARGRGGARGARKGRGAAASPATAAQGGRPPLRIGRQKPGRRGKARSFSLRLASNAKRFPSRISTPSRADGQPVPRGLPADTLNWRNSAPAPAPAPSHPRPPETLHSPAPLAPMRLAPPRPAVEAAAAGTTASTQAATFGRVLSRSAEVFRPRPQSRGPWGLGAEAPGAGTKPPALGPRPHTDTDTAPHPPTPPRPVRTLTPQGHPFRPPHRPLAAPRHLPPPPRRAAGHAHPPARLPGCPSACTLSRALTPWPWPRPRPRHRPLPLPLPLPSLSEPPTPVGGWGRPTQPLPSASLAPSAYLSRLLGTPANGSPPRTARPRARPGETRRRPRGPRAQAPAPRLGPETRAEGSRGRAARRSLSCSPPGGAPPRRAPPVAGLTGGTRPFARCPAPGPRRRVPHDHAVRDGGEAAPHPSAPPAPNHERRSSPGPPADGRAAGYREPTEAPAALRYRYV